MISNKRADEHSDASTGMWRGPLGSAHIVSRESFIIERCKGRSVLHLGCVDYPFLDERLTAGSLLHSKLSRVTSVLYGVDLDESGLDTMRAHGFSHLHHGNVELLDRVNLGRTFDVIVAGEIVEHLANPGLFLLAARKLLNADGELIITVPSAQNVKILANALRRREVVHAHHIAYYSPRTLTHLLQMHGYVVKQLLPYWPKTRTSPFVMKCYDNALRLMRFVSPWLGEGLVAVASSSGPTGRSSR